MSTDGISQLEALGQAARAAARKLVFLSTEVKDRGLAAIAEGLRQREEEVLTANRLDYEEGKAAGLSEALLDRLLLDHRRLEGITSPWARRSI